MHRILGWFWPTRWWQKVFRIGAVLFIAAVLVVGGYVGYLYAQSPEVIRAPKFDHYHFRMQLLVNGQAENFGQDKYQMTYKPGQCSEDLAEEPIHFHDHKDQIVHIHWRGMTGGLVLKNYGWNFVGGLPDALGYKMDNLAAMRKIALYGNVLPALPQGAPLWIYTGDAAGYHKKTLDAFLWQDLEAFFDKQSLLNQQAAKTPGVFDWLFERVSAHGAKYHTEEELQRINNLLGNVVIFVQTNEPSDQEIKSRFQKLEPLSDSTCGG